MFGKFNDKGGCGWCWKGALWCSAVLGSLVEYDTGIGKCGTVQYLAPQNPACHEEVGKVFPAYVDTTKEYSAMI